MPFRRRSSLNGISTVLLEFRADVGESVVCHIGAGDDRQDVGGRVVGEEVRVVGRGGYAKQSEHHSIGMDSR
jgi:hypothetical protein